MWSLTCLTDTSKISSTCGTRLIGKLLDAAGRPQTAERVIKSPRKQVGKKKVRKDQDATWAPGGGCERGKVPHSGKPPHRRGGRPGWMGASEPQRRMQQPEQRGRCTGRQCHRPACPRLRHTPTGAGWGWVLKLRLQTSDQGEDWGWPCKNSLGWLEPDCNHNWGCAWRKSHCLRGQATLFEGCSQRAGEKAMAPHFSTLLPGKSHGRRSLVDCNPWGCTESDTTEKLRFHFSLSCIGEGNGNPLQCSCLENPRDGGAWWAAIYGVAQSQTWLNWLSSSTEDRTPPALAPGVGASLHHPPPSQTPGVVLSTSTPSHTPGHTWAATPAENPGTRHQPQHLHSPVKQIMTSTHWGRREQASMLKKPSY